VELLLRLTDAAKGNEIRQPRRANAAVVAKVLTQAARPHSDDSVVDGRYCVIVLLLIHVGFQARGILLRIRDEETSVAGAGSRNRRDDNLAFIGGSEAGRPREQREEVLHFVD